MCTQVHVILSKEESKHQVGYHDERDSSDYDYEDEDLSDTDSEDDDDWRTSDLPLQRI